MTGLGCRQARAEEQQFAVIASREFRHCVIEPPAEEMRSAYLLDRRATDCQKSTIPGRSVFARVLLILNN
jgi:hypothetical protein